MAKFQDLTGQRFGRLTVLKVARRHTYPSGQSRLVWRCACSCGNTTEVISSDLRSGHTRSCGCLLQETVKTVNLVHGASRRGHRYSREYRSWEAAKRRCFNPNDPKFAAYGGRGITMCERWRDDFEAFLADMGACPKGYTLDRIDVNGNYEPGNCRWATPKQQARNTRSNVMVSFQGRQMVASELAELLGRDASLVLWHVHKGRSGDEIAQRLNRAYA